MKKVNKVIFGLAGLCGLAGLLYFVEFNKRREKNMNKAVPGKENKIDVELKTGKKTLTDRDREALANHIKAMSPEELEIVIEAMPVHYCLGRIQKELDQAREFETMIKKAYEMKRD